MRLPDRGRAVSIVITSCVAVLAGVAARFLGLPLPWLLGPLIATAALAVSGMKIAGAAPQFPGWARMVAVPVIGVMIGSAATPELAAAIPGWWPSLLALAPVIVGLQLMNYAVLRRFGGYDAPTAFFGASPGGLIEAVLIGEKAGGHVPSMSIQHLGRVSLSVITVPLIFQFSTGEAVGSAAGVTIEGSGGALSVTDVAWLLGAGVVGLAIGRSLRLPAAPMVGPMLASAAIHMTGISEASVPPLLVSAAQLVIGTVIGLRFVGQNRASLLRGMRLSLITVGLSMSVAAGVALALSAAGVAGWQALFLSFAPGGLAEMGLIAISLDASPVYVTAHHILRIMLAVSLSQLVFRLIHRGTGPRAGPRGED